LIAVRLFNALPEVARSGRRKFEVSCSPGITVASVLAAEGLPAEKLGIILVNGRHATVETHLQDGDRLALFTPAGGG